MTDLAQKMLALRDRKGWNLADGLVRQAAKDAEGTVESLTTRFRYVGVTHPSEVLQQLVQLRHEALSGSADNGSGTATGVGSGPADGSGPAADGSVSTGWSGPPAWYRQMAEAPVPEPPAPSAPAAEPVRPSGDAPSGPPAWYRAMAEEQTLSAPGPGPTDPAAAPGPLPATPAGVSGPPPGPRAVTEADLPDLVLVSRAVDDFAESDGRMRVAVDAAGRTVIHWSPRPATTGSIVYLLCGAAATVPSSVDLGGRLVLTLANQVVLDSTEHGYFAVYAYEVGDAADLVRAVAVRHAVGRALAEVRELEVEAAEHGVLLSWRRPTGVDRIRVMRSRPDQPLPAGPDPSLLVAFSGDRFRDGDVEPGATYSYRVYTEAAALGAADGSFESSPGLVRTVTVPGRPDAVSDLDATVVVRDGRVGVSASWSRPVRGSVSVHLAPGAPNGETMLAVPQSPAQWELQEPLLGPRCREPVTPVPGETDGPDGAGRDRIVWTPLDTQADGGRHSQWTVSVVTEFSGVRVIGAQKTILHVGDIEELEIEERLDWQLVRSTWPTGASFLGVWVVAPGEPSWGPPARSVTREQFELHGGVTFALGPEPVDVLLQGYTLYGGNPVSGGQFRTSYPGRWTVRYELNPVGRFGSGRRLALQVDRAGWPDLSFLLIADPTGFPLSADGPSVQTVHRGELPASALQPGQWVTAAPEVKVPRNAATRLMVWTSHGLPVAVVDPLTAVEVARPAPRAVAGLRCPRCLRASDPRAQYFRCEGSCAREPDLALTYLRSPGATDPGQMIVDRPVFVHERQARVERRTEVLEPPVDTALCPRCQQASQRHVCPQCHTDLPPHWWSADVLGVVMIGARSSGKTTYLSELIDHLERVVLPGMGGHLQPIDPASQAKLDEHRAGYRKGRLAQGTQSAGAEPAVLRPMIASLGHVPGGRQRTLALFDVAGEDMSRAETVRPYAPALAGADLIVLLIDPLQLNGVREWVQGTVPLPPQGDSALTVVGNAIQEIRRLTNTPVDRLAPRVAVVIGKFDGLQAAARATGSSVSRLIGPGNRLWQDPYAVDRSLYLEPDGRRVHDEVRALLLAMNEHTLVHLVENSFEVGHVRYFAVSSLGHGPRGRQLSEAGASPQRVGDPLRWLLWSAGWGS